VDAVDDTSDAPASLRARLAADARRALGAAVVATVAFAAVELVATLIAAPALPSIAAVACFVPLALALSALLGVALVAAFVAVALAARLVAVARARARGLAWRGAFAPDRPPDPAVATLLGATAGVALFVAGSTTLGAWLAARFKEPTLVALVAALGQLVLAAIAYAAFALVAAVARRLAARLHPRLGRASPFGARAAALAALAVVALGAIAGLTAALPQVRPLLPWRHFLAGFAVVAGAELAAAVFGPGRRPWPWPRARARRRLALAAIALGLAAGVPAVLATAGADPTAKALALSSSPPLATLIGAARALNDFDRDGYGSLLGENDCAPFDGARHPLARDVPDNRVDENCDGRDFSLGRVRPYTPGARQPVPDAYRGPWNVLLITIDTVRYDHTTMGGYAERRGRDTTPNLAKLARRAVSFAFANAPSAGTMASVPAILTSRFFHSGIALGPERKGKPPKLEPKNVLISELLKKVGYTTGAILTHEYFADWGMEQGFDTYDNTLGGSKPEPYRVSADRLTDRALAWIGEHGAKRWFLWAHYIDPHGRYVAHPEGPSWGSTEEDLYDGELRFADHHIGRLLDELERLPGADRTVVIVTSDHGDAFNEHGFINHGQALYVELLHVPLIVFVPNIAPRVVDGPVSPLDIFPTIADLAGADTSGLDLAGESLIPQLFYDRDARDRVVFAETNFPRPIRAVVTATHKLIYKLKENAYELYDLELDPREQTNLWPGGQPAAFDKLRGYLDDWLERVYFARDPSTNQAMSKLGDVLLAEVPHPRLVVEGGSFDDGAIEVLGADVTPAEAIGGDALEVAVYLRAVRRPSADFLLQVEARPLGGDGKTLRPPATASSGLRATAGGTLPTSRWRDGELIRDRFEVRVPAHWTGPDGGTLVLGLRLADARRKRLTPTGPTVPSDPQLLRLGELSIEGQALPPSAPK
jgi:arylsulfatase A-like enzyme